MVEPLTSIIIVNWNGSKYLNDCITSLENQTYKNYEIILVDNASSDGSVEFVEKQFPKVYVIKNKENVGFAEGNNIGIRNSKGEIIALFNPDAVADKNWLSNLISILQSSDNVGAAMGKMYYLGDQYGKDRVFCTWPKIGTITAMPYNFHDNEPVSKVDYLSGAAMVVKKSVIDKIGLLDAGYFLYFEETDWCGRMIRAGYDLLYSPYAVVWHVVSAIVSESDRKIYLMERSRIRFVLKNFDTLYLITFSFLFMGETIFVMGRDIIKMNFIRTKIRIRAICWNLIHLGKTITHRRKDMNILRKNKILNSYNKSLPLRNVKIRK